MDTTLREALRKTRELRNQVENVLLGPDGDRWEAELRKFLSKRICWAYPRMEFFLSPQQQAGKEVTFDELHEALKKAKVLSRVASFDDGPVLDWSSNAEFYPWQLKKHRKVLLWGTLGGTDRGPRYVHYFEWRGDDNLRHTTYEEGRHLIGPNDVVLLWVK